MNIKVNIVLVLCLLVSRSNGNNLYRKFMALNDPDYSTLYKPLTILPSKSLPSLYMCAAYANSAIDQANISVRASAFKYIGGVCTLGRTPVYDDQVVAKPTVKVGTAGVFAVVGVKPIATIALSDPNLVAYFLFNEVSDFTHPFTPGLTNLTQNNSTGPWSFPTKNLLVSPVKMLEGQFAAKGFPELRYRHNPRTYQTLTVMLWYNPGSTVTPNDTLYGMYDDSGLNYIVLYTQEMNYEDYSCSGYTSMDKAYFDFSLVKSTWSYIGFTYDTAHVTLYTNGSVQSTFTLVKTCGSPPGILRNYTNIQIGIDGPTPLLKGYISTLEIYDVAMTQAQVVQAMQKSTTTNVLKTK